MEMEKALRRRRGKKNYSIKGLSNETTLEFDNYHIFYRDLFPSSLGATLHYRK
jgi:hypothetical protein